MTRDPAFDRWYAEFLKGQQRRNEQLVDAFLATGRPQWEFSLWLRQQRDQHGEGM